MCIKYSYILYIRWKNDKKYLILFHNNKPKFKYFQQPINRIMEYKTNEITLNRNYKLDDPHSKTKFKIQSKLYNITGGSY